MLKIVQARLQQYVYCELPDAQAGFRKGRGTRDQIANIRWIIKKGRELQKKSTSALLTMSKPLSGGSQYTVGNSSRDENTRPLTCLLQKLYAGQEQHLEPDMQQQTGSKPRKEYIKAVYCHPACLTFGLCGRGRGQDDTGEWH